MDNETKEKLLIVIICAILLCALRATVDFLPQWAFVVLRDFMSNFENLKL